jgi:hypothetical protein
MLIKKLMKRYNVIKRRRIRRNKIDKLLRLSEERSIECTFIWDLSDDPDIKREAPKIHDTFKIFGYPVEFHDINWHKDYVSGFVYPRDRFDKIIISRWYDKGIDIKFPWELSRFYFAVPLAQNYFITKDVRYYNRFKELVEDWIENNPFLFGVNWHCTMEVAIRAINWIIAVNLMKDKFVNDEVFYRLLLDSLVKHANYIYSFPEFKHNGLGNNHLIADYCGLLFLSTTLKNHPQSKVWLETSVAGLCKCMDTQVNDDGTSFEGSIPYHRLVLEMFAYTAILCRTMEIDLPERYYTKLFKMFEFTAAYVDHNGNAPQIGDNDSGRIIIFHESDEHDHSYLVSIGKHLFNQTLYTQCLKRNCKISNWLPKVSKIIVDKNSLVANSWSQEGYFPKGGYYFLKNKNMLISVIVMDKTTRERKGHIHLDIGSITLSYKGNPFIIDPGTFSYTRNQTDRLKYISDTSHNISAVKNEKFEHSHISGYFGIEVNNRIEILELGNNSISFEHDYYGIPVNRRINLKGKSLYINDNCDKPILSYFHLHPECSVEQVNQHKLVVRRDEFTAELVTLGSLLKKIYYYSEGYEVRRRAHLIISSESKAQKVEIKFL